jgi:hypothetical protein
MLRVRVPVLYAPPTITTLEVWVNVGGVWKQATVQANVLGTWYNTTPSVNVLNVWE